jgi:hypothetical protein
MTPHREENEPHPVTKGKAAPPLEESSRSGRATARGDGEGRAAKGEGHRRRVEGERERGLGRDWDVDARENQDLEESNGMEAERERLRDWAQLFLAPFSCCSTHLSANNRTLKRTIHTQ